LIFYTSEASIKKARIKRYLSTHFQDVSKCPVVYIVVDQGSVGFASFLKHKQYFGWTDAIVKNIESLPKPPPTPRAKRVANTDEVYYAPLNEYISPPKVRYHNRYISWNKKSATFDSAGTYYYIDFFYSEPRWGTKVIGTDIFEGVVKVFVDKKLNGTETVVYGINVKNKHLLKVGKWINVMDLVKTQLDKTKNENEELLYLACTTFAAVDSGLLGIYNQLSRSSAYISRIENKDTLNLFKDFVNIVAASQRARSEQLVPILTFFGHSAKKHSNNHAFDFGNFKNLLKNKYFGLLELCANTYNFDLNVVFKVINFVDKKS
jgi:hypothetical protein